jgi:SAM-dependent methyltransferase
VVEVSVPKHYKSVNTFREYWDALGVRNMTDIRGKGTPYEHIRPSEIQVEKANRNKGLGTAFMQDLTEFADLKGMQIRINPSDELGATSKSRLEKFYKRFGFVENKPGKNKDYAISERFYREPKRIAMKTKEFRNPVVFPADDITFAAASSTTGLLRKVIKRKGYDGIRYKNENEGRTDDPTNIAWIAFSPGQVKSATENIRTFDRRDPDIRNPMDSRSAKTQIATTVDTYRKAAPMLTGRVIDYGAGLGLGTDALREKGVLADSFEPYPERWKGKRPPAYTDSAKIPSSSYDSLVSFSVINVVEPDVRKFLFQEVSRILRPNGIALITGRTRQDVDAAKIKTPHLEEGGYLIGADQRYQKGFTQAELERYAKEVLGPGFTVQKNGSLNGASIKISKGKTNPVTRSMIRTKLSRILEPGDRVLDYDRAQGEDLYRLWDMVHTDKPLTKESLTEIEGLLDDDGVLVIQSGEEPSGLQDHFRKATRYQGMLLVQGPMNPEEARINTEKLRRDLE